MPCKSSLFFNSAKDFGKKIKQFRNAMDCFYNKTNSEKRNRTIVYPLRIYKSYSEFDNPRVSYQAYDILTFCDFNFFNNIASPDGINNFQSLVNLTKTGVITVEVLGVFTVMTDKKLGTACISAGMSHT